MGEAKDWMAYVQGTAAVANLQALRERARFSEVLHPRPSEEPPSAHLVSCHSEMKPWAVGGGSSSDADWSHERRIPRAHRPRASRRSSPFYSMNTYVKPYFTPTPIYGAL